MQPANHLVRAKPCSRAPYRANTRSPTRHCGAGGAQGGTAAAAGVERQRSIAAARTPACAGAFALVDRGGLHTPTAELPSWPLEWAVAWSLVSWTRGAAAGEAAETAAAAGEAAVVDAAGAAEGAVAAGGVGSLVRCSSTAAYSVCSAACMTHRLGVQAGCTGVLAVS